MGGNVGGEVFPNQINEVNPAIVQQPQQNAPPFPHLQALQRNMVSPAHSLSCMSILFADKPVSTCYSLMISVALLN